MATLIRVIVLIFAGSFLAQGAAAEPVVINADAYFDAAMGELVSPAVIVVDGDQIIAVNPSTVPDGAMAIDLSGHTLVPGLIDVHTHLTYDIEPGFAFLPVTQTVGEFALRGAKNARKTLLAGFTTVRDVGAGGFSDVALMHAIDRGWVPGPRIFPSGHALSITGGHCEVTGFIPGVLEGSYMTGAADGVDEVIKAVRYQIKHGAKSIKICATAGVLSAEGPAGAQQYSFEEMRAIVEEAERHGVRVAAHAHGTDGIIAAARAGIHSIEHDTIMTREAAEIIKEMDAWVDPNLYLIEGTDLSALPPNMLAKFNAIAPRMADSFKLALEMELKIAFGTDAGVYPHGLNGREFGARVAAGQAPVAALQSATIISADLLQVSDRGRIAAGLLADIIAVPGNPLEDITLMENVTFVMKAGEVFKHPGSTH